jgi:hypothetical protein
MEQLFTANRAPRERESRVRRWRWRYQKKCELMAIGDAQRHHDDQFSPSSQDERQIAAE